MTSLAKDPGRVRDLAASIARRALTSQELVQRCLDRIGEVDAQVQAWIHVLTDEALETARALDAELPKHGPRGPLHGIPVAVKDVIDVAGLPTRANSASRADAAPATADATVVAHLRAAGAVILGKVHTTEFAYYQSVPPTRNPHDLSRTPGGSSAGSSAAVAAGMVPLALGTQTAGSVNRPAAYTGIGAFKPSTLAIGGAGVVPLAPTYDTVGGFGGAPEDAVMLVAAYAADHLRLGEAANAGARGPERVIKLTDPVLDAKAAPAVKTSLDALAGRLENSGLGVETAASPAPLADILADHRIVLLYEMGRLYGGTRQDLLAPKLAEDIAQGLTIAAATYHAALHRLALARRAFWSTLGDDAMIVMPAAPDIAPADGTTGDPSFVIPSTVLGGPVATVRGAPDPATGMPIGALLMLPPGHDRALASFLLAPRARELGL